MTDIHERMAVECPFERAPAYVRAYLARHTTAPARSAAITMRLPLGDVALEHYVEVSLAALPEHALGNIVAVDWRPKGGGPYPAFTGTLAFHAEGEEACAMALDGEYEPPGGALGKAFDAAVGRRISTAGVKNLLLTFKREIEGAYREEVERVAGSGSPNYPPSYE